MGTSKYKESAPGTYYHIYNRGNQKNTIFKEIDDYKIYLRGLGQATKKFNFSLISYCLMPNHIHLLARQNEDSPPSKFISSLHTSYSMIFNKKYDSVGHLFQGRFKQKIIQNDEYMLGLIAYIHLNPVKDRLCRFPKEYMWSSYREYVGWVRFPLCDRALINNYRFKGQSFEDFINLAGKIDPMEAFDN